MSRELFVLVVIFVLVSTSVGCSSYDNKNQTAKDVLQDWRDQDFDPIEETTVPNPPKGETPSGSIACPINITDYRQRIDGNRVYIEGNAYNYGDSSYKNPKITCLKLYIIFYNKNLDVIGEEYYYFDVGELSYGEKYPFAASANIRSGTDRWKVLVRCCNR